MVYNYPGDEAKTYYEEQGFVVEIKTKGKGE
jgi:hypothetical protein